MTGSNRVRSRQARRFRIGGLFLCALGGSVAVVGISLFTWTMTTPDAELPTPYFAYTVGFAFAIATMISVSLYRRGLRYALKARRARIVPREMGSGNVPSSPYVLYLRPFVDDQEREVIEEPLVPMSPITLETLLISGRTEEEQLVESLASVGKLIAVGSPRDDVPPAGADRFYLTSSTNWKEEVRRLLRKARFVVLVLGSSYGTLWEVFQVLAWRPVERFAFIVAMGRSEYGEFVAHAHKFLKEDGDDDVRSSVQRRFGRNVFPQYNSGDHGRSRMRGIIYYTRSHQPVFVDLHSVGQLGGVYYGEVFLMLESAFRPLLRRLTEHEEASTAQLDWRIEEQENWYLQWSRSILPDVIFAVLPGVAGFILHGLFGGFQSDYSLGAIAATSTGGIVLGMLMRRHTFPWSGRLRTSGLEVVSWIVTASAAVFILFPHLGVRVATPYVFIFLLLGCFAGFSVQSAHRLLDYLVAGSIGVLAGQLYRVIAEFWIPDALFSIGFQFLVTFFVTLGITAVLHKRQKNGLVERIGLMEAGLLSLGVYAVYFGVTESLEPPSALSIMVMFTVSVVCIITRLAIARINAPEGLKFILLALIAASAVGSFGAVMASLA